MKFKDLTKYFEKLEQTSSRLSLIEILSELLKKTPGEEIDKISYLIQGRLAPFFVPLEIGMAEKTVAKAIAQAYGVTSDEVTRQFNSLGDMGLAAQKFAVKSKGTDITVNEIHKTLAQIAKTNGEGTVKKRQKLLSGLLSIQDLELVIQLY